MKLLTQSVFVLALSLASAPLLAAGLGNGNASAGKAKSAVCAACHGADGNSTSAMYPKLAGQGAIYLEKQLHDFKSGTRKNGIMLGMASGLSDKDIENLAAYFASQKMSIGEADPKLAKAGAAIYRGGVPDKGIPACAACHGPAGQGLISDGYPHLAGQHAQYIAQELKKFRHAGRGDLGISPDQVRTNDDIGDQPGPMQGIAGKLSDTEIKQVASFISGLHKR